MSPDHDRNLLFGVLALQLDIIDRDQFARACNDWALQSDKLLSHLLKDRGWITSEDEQEIIRNLERKLKKHRGDARASLAEVTTDQVRNSLAGIADPAVSHLIAGLTPPPQGHVLLATTDYVPESRERYTLSRLHATGGIGRVWLARDASLGRDVALKELLPERVGTPALWGRFLREAKVTGQLEHPGIVPVYELGKRPEDQAPFYTMRFIRGRTLAEAATSYHARRKRGETGPLDLRELLTAFNGVCNAIAYAHSRGVIHRDLKPQNVVLGEYGEVMVLDWGLAKVVEESEDDAFPVTLEADSHADSRTIAGQVLGTPAYMAPEQAEGRLDSLDAHTDVYGLGAILYQILTGTPPFTESDTTAILRRVVHDAPAPPHAVVPATPRALEAICLKALAKSPAERYGSATELASEVQHWMADEPVAVYREPITVRLGRWARRHRTAVAVTAALLIVGAAGLVVSNVLVSQQKARAEANFELARTAVDDMYTQVAEKWLAQESRMEPVQREFLLKALRFYEQFGASAGSSPAMRLEAGKAALRVGAIQARLGDTAAADAAYRRSIDILRALAASDQRPVVRLELLQSLNGYGWLLWNVGRSPDEALREARDLGESLADEPIAPVETREVLSTTYANLGIIDQACGRFAAAEQALGRVHALRAEIVQAEPTCAHRAALGRAQQRLARYLVLVGRYREAEMELGRSIEESAAAAAADCPREPRPRFDLAYDLLERANLFNRLGRLKEYEADLRRGLAIAEALVAEFPSVTDYKEVLSAIRRDLGGALRGRQQLADARQALLTAIAEGEALVKESPDVVGYRWNLSVHYVGLTDLENSAGRIVETEAPARRALALAEEISAKVPTRVDYRALVANRRFELADVLANLNRRSEAIAVYEKARAEYEALIRDCPAVPEYRSSLVILCVNMGNRLREGHDLAGAEAAYARAVALAEVLARDYPVVPLYRIAPINARVAFAKLAVFRNDAAKARPLLEQSIHELEAVLRTDPENPDARDALYFSIGYLAQAQVLAGDLAAAEATAKRCEDAATFPSQTWNCSLWRSRMIKQSRQSTAPGPDRDAFAQRQADQAMVQLKKAKAAGYQITPALIDEDEDFDAIRSREDFQAFRREIENAKPPETK